MANIRPFRALRYSASAGDPARLLTQPYDKITPAMRERYLQLSPYNMVRIILNPEPDPYGAAARHLRDWITTGILEPEPQPALFRYTQEFDDPDSGDRLVREGFIGLGEVSDYADRVVFRHERTLSGPKKDRLELLRQTRAHFGQIFMLYPDREGAVESELATAAAPDVEIADEYGAIHRLWRVANDTRIRAAQNLMAEKKLLIADGHHRYETALAFRQEHPEVEDARWVMMTFVNLYSPGLRILATHRVLTAGFRENFAAMLSSAWTCTGVADAAALKARMQANRETSIRIGVAWGSSGYRLLERPRQPGEMDVPVLHQEILGAALSISEEAVREERCLKYVRGFEAAIAMCGSGEAEAAFLLNPTPVEKMAEVAYGGGVMPQKSTDFYPKLLSGLTVYRMEH
ncbi:MAG: DUF1015 domain-containing protein [Bryobacteraceae bacterium]|nr:DUF1015 domain-containing protein [Bryobacteraceae bacterium]